MLKKKQILFIGYCLVISFITIFICSKNSPLYPFNDWVDENAFFTVAKSWFNGLIPYRDLFEQKGPLLYLIFMIGYLISKHSFIGIFIIEVISMTICLYYVSKIINLYLKKEYAYYILPLFSSIICSSIYFVQGGSTEEFCFPLMAITIYYFLNYFKTKEIKKKELFFNGFIAGLISMLKFNLLGLWFAFMLCIFIDLLLHKKIKEVFISCIYFLLGMIIPITLFSLYFYLNNSLKVFIDTYFLFNIHSYVQTLSLSERIQKDFTLFFYQIRLNYIIFNLIDVGLLYFVFSRKLLKNIWAKISLVILFILSFFGIFWGGFAFQYYFLFMTFYLLLGLVAFFYQVFQDKKFNYIILLFCLIISLLFLKTSPNLAYRHNKKEDIVQYKFASIINQKENATLLNYGFLDGGFYFASDIIPNTRYFELPNAVVPNMEETLESEISNKKFDYIVLRGYDGYDPETKLIKDNYKLVAKDSSILENIEFTYYLYAKKVA